MPKKIGLLMNLFGTKLKKDRVKVCSEYNFQNEFMEKEFAIILEARGD